MPGRLYADTASNALASSQVTLSANWGTAPVLTIATGSNDQRGRLTIGAKATVGANPTVAVVFAQAFESAPFVIACKGNIADVDPVAVTAQTTTGFTITWVGTPTQDVDHVINYIVIG